MTDKLKDIREGDTVDVTFRGTVHERDGASLDLIPEGGCSGTMFDPADVASPHFSIKKVERPIQIGERVRSRGIVAKVVGLDDDLAWVRYERDICGLGQIRGVVPLSELERL